LLIAVAIGPASAVDLGLDGNVAGARVDVGVSTGSQDASARVGASVGGIGNVDAGASVGNGSVDASVDGTTGGIGVSGGGSVGSRGASAGVGASVGGIGDVGALVGSSGGTAGASGVSADAVAGSGASVGPAAGASRNTIATGPPAGRRNTLLPCRLRPSGCGRREDQQVTVGYPIPFPSLRAIRGTPPAVVRACRNAILSAARPLGAVRVQAASAGPLSRQRRGALTAPIVVRIDYASGGGIKVRQAKVTCRLDAAGKVIAVT
jgi:hypothetical protein